MKSLFILPLVAASLFLSSCSSLKLEDVGMVAQIAVPPAVKLAVSKEPSSEKYFEALATGISTFATTDEFDPIAFEAFIETFEVNEIETPEAKAALKVIVSAYKTYYSDKVVGKAPELTKFLAILAEGIRQGLV